MKTHDHAEYVSPGHPDRLADSIANGIVDQAQWPLPTPKQPARSLVGIEVAVHDNTVFIDGRIAQERWENVEYEEFPHFPSIVRDAYKEAGYNEEWGPDPNKLEIIERVCLEYLSGEEASIRPYSDDQNIVIGYATARPETNHLPPAHWLAHHIGNRVLEFRKTSPHRFGPDFKVLVDITDDGGVIVWRKLVLSIQHAQGIDMEDQHRTFLPFLAEALSDVEKSGLAGAGSSFSPNHLHLNGGGDFVVGGPRGDNGLSGKKLVVDHYGPSIPIGGGALSGKDVWKVDRCGPLRARQLAKRLVATGHHEAKVHLGWAPGEDIPSVRDAFVRNDSGSHWLEVPASRLPRPDWFSIQSIVHDLELTSIPWKKIPVAGTFVDPKLPWERI
jgi:S-adenosylmethionine synthetase